MEHEQSILPPARLQALFKVGLCYVSVTTLKVCDVMTTETLICDYIRPQLCSMLEAAFCMQATNVCKLNLSLHMFKVPLEHQQCTFIHDQELTSQHCILRLMYKCVYTGTNLKGEKHQQQNKKNQDNIGDCMQGTPEGVEDNGSLTRVAAFPIGIDPERFQRALERVDVRSHIAELLNRYAGRKVPALQLPFQCS